MDVAQIGFAADTSELKQAKSDIQALIPPAKAAEKEAEGLAGAFGKVDKAADKLSTAATNLNSAVDRLVGGLATVDTATAKAAAGVTKVDSASQQAARGVFNLGVAIDEAVFAKRRAAAASHSLGQALSDITSQTAMAANGARNLGAALEFAASKQLQTQRGVHGLADAIAAAGKSMKLTAREGLGFSRQFADIGVTAAMGMNPLMIAIQQGPQLFDILQEKAIATGTSVKAVMASIGASVWAALAPLLPIILAIGAAVGVVVGAFALFSRAVNKGNQDIIGSMGLTEKQLERVKKSGVETGATLGDTFVVTAQVIGKAIMDGPIGDGIKWMGDMFSDLFDFLTNLAFGAVANIIAFFSAGIKTIANNWRQFPSLLGAVIIAAVNVVTVGIQKMINAGIDGINLLIRQANKIKGVDLPEFDRVVLPLAKAVEGSVTETIVGEFDNAFAESLEATKKGMNAIGNEIAKGVRTRVRNRITEAAGDAGGRKRGGKTDAEKFSDIVGGADRDIAAIKAQIAGVNLTASAAARLANEQKLLNEAQQKGLTLTTAQRAQLMALAGTLTDLQMKLKNLEGFKEINEGFDKQFASLMQGVEQIGVYGEALATLQAQQEFVNQAVAKGITLDAQQIATLNAKAAAIGKLTAETQKLQFLENLRNNSAENVKSLQEELSYIGKSADATTRLRIENDLLRQARQAKINLTPEEVAGIKATALEQANLEIEVRKTRDAFEFAKEGARGFISDLRNGLSQGKSIWQSFGDAVINVLNKIIDKMAEVALEQLFNSGGGSGGAGGWLNTALNFAKMFFAKGDVFSNGAATKFAKGSAFSNSVVTRPTMFSFANGTALGEMGEAGPEAIMPLKRGPNGSLGVQMYGSGAGRQSVAVAISVEAGPTEDMWTRVRAVSEETAVDVTRAGLTEYDANMPTRVHEIANDERMR